MSLTTSPVTFARLFVALAGLWALNGCVKQVVSHDRTVAKVVGPTVDANKLLQTQVTPEKKTSVGTSDFSPSGHDPKA
ncbi:MAG: hypothetical protein KatS3mg105_2367 [Gemmatales bacterium]|nr:MAG: hypothetical protein KatS3mg105_2367 [Gemmatales bacterium]